MINEILKAVQSLNMKRDEATTAIKKLLLDIIGADETEHGNKGPAYRNQLRAIQRKNLAQLNQSEGKPNE